VLRLHPLVLIGLLVEGIDEGDGVVLLVVVEGGQYGEGRESVRGEVGIDGLDWLEVDHHLLLVEGRFAALQVEDVGAAERGLLRGRGGYATIHVHMAD
jgi:hypothetical protein